MFKILIIDDSDTIRSQLSEMIDSIDRCVVTAADGKEGLERLSSNPDVSLIFCDINMPVMSGLEFVETVAGAVKRGDMPQRPIVILSTESEMEKVLRAKKAGVQGWLIKPPRDEAIEKILNKFTPLTNAS